MELGEAVQTAIERGLPLLLSTEAAGELKDTVRVGRMKGRPGVLTITTADGLSATTRRVVAEQAIAELRALQRAGAKRHARRRRAPAGADDARAAAGRRPGAARPPAQLAALKVVGSGVDATQTGTGKTITTGRALAHRAAPRRGFRAMIVAEGRLLGQWRDELPRGAPARGLPPLAPNVEVLVLADRRSDRRAAPRLRPRARRPAPASCSWPTACSTATRPSWQAIAWHLLIADEALRYANPATDAHQALAQLRFGVASPTAGC